MSQEKTIQVVLHLLFDTKRCGGVYRTGNYNVSRDELENAIRVYLKTGENPLFELDRKFDSGLPPQYV